MSNWYIGQKVVCVVEGSGWVKGNNFTWIQRQWYLFTGKRPKSNGPNKGDVLIVKWVYDFEGSQMLMFEGWASQGFHANCFRPIDALTETMERIEKEGAPLELETA